MSRTYRNSACNRKPKGFKNAVVNKARPKAIPPTEWDIFPLKAGPAFKAGLRMFKKGWSMDRVDRRLRKNHDASIGLDTLQYLHDLATGAIK